ncbi:gas vesicle protein GvpU [Bacillus sp. FJAT-18017]|uniref:gas vesicle accessory protein GvpU n=1 Tax=Bacillus sp. FJAT-18017 TaxID=1705566 RepID=UPI0006AEFFF9|nr:gas vesicle accessory protein GvpU [Bacillus sp. FJAT-18017]ALC88584.1 gas vesicle protein GvpU [Bacillus sp. FJAT-18017]
MSNQPEPKDTVLELFVQAANNHGFNLDITLNVKGAVVTGTIISARDYFESLSGTVEDGSDVAEKLSDMLSNAGESAGSESQPEANYIHLKNANVYVGDSKPTPSKGDILWRGKLSEVDGFFIGRIVDGKSKDS